MNLPVKIRRDWHYYAFAIGLIFILNGVVGLLGFEAKGWQTYAVGLVTWVISFWLAGLIIRRRDEETENAPITEDWAFWGLTKCSLFLPDAARTPYPAYKIMQNQYIAIIW